MKKFKWCVIGTGGIADRRVIPAMQKDEKSELVAVMDKNEAVAKRLSEKYGVPSFTSEKDLLQSVDCDAVYIGTPVALHFPQAKLSLESGKHVLVEKPIAISSSDGENLLAIARHAGEFLSVGYMMEYHSLHQRAKELIEEGKIGRVCSVHARFSCWYPPIEGAWRQQKALGGGGAMMDLGVHCIDLIEWLLDTRISEVKSFCKNRTFRYEAEDEAAALFMTENGVLGDIAANFNIPDACESRLEVYGESGSILLYGTLGQEEKGTLTHLFSPQGDYSAMQTHTTAQTETFRAEGGDLYYKQLSAFRREVESGNFGGYAEAKRAIGVQRTIEKIYENS